MNGCPAMNINVSMAAFPGKRHLDAVRFALEPQGSLIYEGPWGALSTDHIQLVPQCLGVLTEELAQGIAASYPNTRFRLHANARVLREHGFADLSNAAAHGDYFEQAARVHKWVGAGCPQPYSAHSGRRSESSMSEMLDAARRLADLFDAPVAVEGQYPKPVRGRGSIEWSDGEFLVSNWAEYRALFESGVPYALDLSHLNILASATGQRNEGLVKEMLSSERCLECHVSSNDGTGDHHQVLSEAENVWWMPLLAHIGPNCVVFSEGNQLRRRQVPN